MKQYGESLYRPYQCFMGKWEGLCKTFDVGGQFIESTHVHMDVYWQDDTTWHLHEYFKNLYQVGETTFHSDIKVEGKRCFASSEMLSLEGTELTPYNYVFTIESGVTKTTVLNNHYFLDPNTRRIITHKMRNGKTHCFQIQDFTRIVQP
ncbi:MAG: hypothetical protein NTX25_16625 [Proteobacteria bacterium]|nr:hypothetical protein [Pseudomonadota bacterium]